jgi:rhodanese-related sulfurtransferase
MLLSMSACSQPGRVENSSFDFVLKTLLDHSVPEMDVAHAPKPDGAIRFIDAREKAEFNVSHIQGAVWAGFDDFDLSRLADVPKTDTVIVYCSVGYRSEKVALQLEEAGYQHVWNLYGGIFEWKNTGRTVVAPDGSATDRVHAFDKNWGRWLTAGVKVYD